MLTKRQKQILDYIKKYIKKKKYAPTLNEIKKHFRLSSVATVHQHVEALEKKDYLKKTDNQSRAIKLNKKENKLIEIPLSGTITAGEPIEAIEEKEKIKVTESQLSKSGKHYALKVKGDSMIEEGILDGDIVIIREQPDVENGETAVALINGENVTLKKIYKEKSGFKLQPANSNLKPIYTKNLIIQGKVVSIIRNFKELKKTIKDRKEFTAETINYIKNTDLKYRKSLGQYFTPKSIRKRLINKLPNKKASPKVLDPACGTGEFLITVKKHFKKPKLYGWEIDNKLTKKAKKVVPTANIEKTDTLKKKIKQKYDFIIGNPPYYEFKPKKEIKKEYKEILNGRVNIYSLFIYKGIKLLKKGGYLAFVVSPSMNNGAYFSKLRKFIIKNCNIEYLSVLQSPELFQGALQSVMLLILKKGKNKGDYIFKKNGILIFSEKANYLKKIFKNNTTLHNLNYRVRTGKLVWNENKDILTNKSKGNVTIIWSHNITKKGLKLKNNKKPQFAKTNDYSTGPAIATNRIIGRPGKAKLKAAFIPKKMEFIAENHTNIIYPSQQKSLLSKKTSHKNIKKIVSQLNSKKNINVLQSITGNTQISKNELEKLFPISLK